MIIVSDTSPINYLALIGEIEVLQMLAGQIIIPQAVEHHSALFRDPTNQQRRFIPVRLDDTEVKDTPRQFAYVDWRQKADEEYSKLLVSCLEIKSDSEFDVEQESQSELEKILFSGRARP